MQYAEQMMNLLFKVGKENAETFMANATIKDMMNIKKMLLKIKTFEEIEDPIKGDVCLLCQQFKSLCGSVGTGVTYDTIHQHNLLTVGIENCIEKTKIRKRGKEGCIFNFINFFFFFAMFVPPADTALVL